MKRNRVIRTLAELEGLDLDGLPDRSEPQRVLMCTPEHFDIVEVQNALMTGSVGSVDKAKACVQWERLRETFERRGHEVVTIEGVEGIEDMVFSANQVLPGLDADGSPYVVLGRMRHASRQREIPYYRRWFEQHGYRIVELPETVGAFEGQGDAIWHPEKQLLWGGYGQRTRLEAYDAIAEALEVPVIALELVHPRFYHLDTAFCALSAQAALMFPGAFSGEGRAMVERMFPRVISVSEKEATDYVCCNAHALDGRTVILQHGATDTVGRLREEGFEPVEVETGEFLKSGGSVFCMKMMVY